MKKDIVSIFLSTILFSSLSLAFMDGALAIQPDRVHVPAGFDSNDNAEIIITGMRSGCSKKPKTKITIDKTKISIVVFADKLGSDDMCMKAMMPFMVSSFLGALPEGHYDIVVNPGQNTELESEIMIDKPQSKNIDNFTYANVNSVEKSIHKKAIVIKGFHVNSCVKLQDVSILPNKNFDTFAVLPIVKKSDAPCEQKLIPFTYMIPVPSFDQEVIFHVRGMDGTAINVRL